MSEALLIVVGSSALGLVLAMVVVAVAVRFGLSVFRYFADMFLYAGLVAGFEVAVRIMNLSTTAPYAALMPRGELFIATGVVLKTLLLGVGFVISRLLVSQIAAFTMQVFEVISATVVFALLLGLVLQRSIVDVLTMIGIALIAVGFLSKTYVDGIMRVIKMARDPNINVGDWVTIGEKTGRIEEFTVDGVILRSSNRELLVIAPQQFEGGVYVNHSLIGDSPYVAEVLFGMPLDRRPEAVKREVDAFLAPAEKAKEIVGKSFATMTVDKGEIRYRLSLQFATYEKHLEVFPRLRSGLLNHLVVATEKG